MELKLFGRRINKIPLVIFIITIIYTSGLFIAPLTLEPGTVEGLEGNANMLDFQEKWHELPAYHRAIYTFSDFNCHQKYYRSYHINGNQMPVCARDVGIFLGLSFGFFIMLFITPSKDYKDILLKLLPIKLKLTKTQKSYLLVVLGALFVLPMALDGGLQLVTAYESTNPMRLLTGFIFGFGFSAFVSAILLSAEVEIKETKTNENTY
ncbi:MAG: DUF2085 domain-containing protein [Candidatus Saliniplasma sp.]